MESLTMEANIHASIAELSAVLARFDAQTAQILQGSAILIQTLQAGGKVLTCGNGGSAADALHLAEELVGKFLKPRRSLPVICLAADPTLLTCIANDFGFDHLFSRQIEGLGKTEDVLGGFFHEREFDEHPRRVGSGEGERNEVNRAARQRRREGARTGDAGDHRAVEHNCAHSGSAYARPAHVVGICGETVRLSRILRGDTFRNLEPISRLPKRRRRYTAQKCRNTKENEIQS